MKEDLKLLVLADRRLSAYAWRKNSLVAEGNFSESAEGVHAFRAYLEQWRHSPFRILADLPDEYFHLASIPPARGADRRALIERRLTQAGAGTPYICAVSQGRLQEGRGDEVLMITALKRPSHFSPWIEQCLEAETRIQEIASPALLLARLAVPASRHEGRYLLFTLGKGGLRQTCFENGQLRFSRLTGHRPQNPREIATACLQEARRVDHYLKDSIHPWSGTTTFHALLSGQDAARFPVAETQDVSPPVLPIDMNVLQAAHGITAEPADGSLCEPLLLKLWAQAPATPALATEDLLLAEEVWQWRRRLTYNFRLGLAVCLAALAGLGIHIQHVTTQAESVEALALGARHQYQLRLNGLPPLPTTPDALQSLCADFHELRRQSLLPETTLRLLSHALDQVPDVTLNRIEWRLSDSLDIPAGRSSHERLPPAAQAVLEFSVSTPQADFAVTKAEALAAQLRRYPNTQVIVVPESKEGTDGKAEEATRFSLQLTHRNIPS